jgi:hypothetical protein
MVTAAKTAFHGAKLQLFADFYSRDGNQIPFTEAASFLTIFNSPSS